MTVSRPLSRGSGALSGRLTQAVRRRSATSTPFVTPPSETRRLSRSAGEEKSAELAICGYASLFWVRDLNDDVVAAGAFADSIARAGPGGIRMLHQHAATPVGVWDDVREDDLGLFVRGRIGADAPAGMRLARLVRAGALDGLSIGFRAVHARTDAGRRLRVLTQVDLAEVSLVSFPMLPGARLSVPSP